MKKSHLNMTDIVRFQIQDPGLYWRMMFDSRSLVHTGRDENEEGPMDQMAAVGEGRRRTLLVTW